MFCRTPTILLALLFFVFAGCSSVSEHCRDQHAFNSASELGQAWRSEDNHNRCRYLNAILGKQFKYNRPEQDLTQSPFYGMAQDDVISILGIPDVTGDSYILYQLYRYTENLGPLKKRRYENGGLLWDDPVPTDVLIFDFYDEDGRLSTILVGR